MVGPRPGQNIGPSVTVVRTGCTVAAMDPRPAASPARGRPGRGLSNPSRPRPSCRVVVLAALALVTACGGSGDTDGSGGDDRQAEVAERGAEVMPFDLDATTHRFEDRPDGLLQTVVADDPDDEAQIALIRDHLAHEAERFGRGDLGDPASIHGDDMPGLAELAAGAASIEVRYADAEAGGRITYTTDDPALVAALHRWGAAQVTDHGDHAEHVGDPEHAG